MNFPINKSDRMITLQFSFPNDDAVPIGLRSLGVEDNTMANQRKQLKARPTGTDLLGGNFPEKVSLVELPLGIIKNGFVLVNAVYQKRQDQHRKDKTYHMIRFVFARKEHEQKEDEQLKKFLPFRGLMLAEMQGICELALWRVRLFRNPYYANQGDFEKGIASPNESAISINFEARVPLFERNNVKLCVIPECSPQFRLEMRSGTLSIDKTA